MPTITSRETSSYDATQIADGGHKNISSASGFEVSEKWLMEVLARISFGDSSEGGAVNLARRLM